MRKVHGIEIPPNIWLPFASHYGKLLESNKNTYALFGAGALAAYSVIIRPTIDLDFVVDDYDKAVKLFAEQPGLSSSNHEKERDGIQVVDFHFKNKSLGDSAPYLKCIQSGRKDSIRKYLHICADLLQRPLTGRLERIILCHCIISLYHYTVSLYHYTMSLYRVIMRRMGKDVFNKLEKNISRTIPSLTPLKGTR